MYRIRGYGECVHTSTNTTSPCIKTDAKITQLRAATVNNAGAYIFNNNNSILGTPIQQHPWEHREREGSWGKKNTHTHSESNKRGEVMLIFSGRGRGESVTKDERACASEHIELD